jgi:hypothetical protein
MSSSGKKSSSKKLKPALKTGSNKTKRDRRIVINEEMNTTDSKIPEPRTDSTDAARWATIADMGRWRNEHQRGIDEASKYAKHGRKSATARRNAPNQAAMAARRMFNIQDVEDTSAERARKSIKIASRAEVRRLKENKAVRAQYTKRDRMPIVARPRARSAPVQPPRPPQQEGSISKAVKSVFGFFRGNRGGKRTRKNRK